MVQVSESNVRKHDYDRELSRAVQAQGKKQRIFLIVILKTHEQTQDLLQHVEY